MNHAQNCQLLLFTVLAGLRVFTDGVAGETVQASQHQVKEHGEWQCPALKDEGVWNGTLSGE